MQYLIFKFNIYEERGGWSDFDKIYDYEEDVKNYLLSQPISQLEHNGGDLIIQIIGKYEELDNPYPHKEWEDKTNYFMDMLKDSVKQKELEQLNIQVTTLELDKKELETRLKEAIEKRDNYR